MGNGMRQMGMRLGQMPGRQNVLAANNLSALRRSLKQSTTQYALELPYPLSLIHSSLSLPSPSTPRYAPSHDSWLRQAERNFSCFSNAAAFASSASECISFAGILCGHKTLPSSFNAIHKRFLCLFQLSTSLIMQKKKYKQSLNLKKAFQRTKVHSSCSSNAI